jgi:hypothetical protein
MTYDDWKLDTPPHCESANAGLDDESNWTDDDWAADLADRYNDDRPAD